jgi:hypothetical protein
MRTNGSESHSNRRRRLVLSLVALGLSVTAILAFMLSPARRPARRTLEIELRVSAGSGAQLYWADARSGISDERSTRTAITQSGGLQPLRFVLPREPLTALRFDPTDAPGEVWIGRVRVLDSDGHTVASLNPASFAPAHQIASMKREGDLTHLVVTPDGRDPYVLIPVACLDGPAPWYSVTSVSPLALTLSVLGVVALLAAACATIGRDVWASTMGSGDGGHGADRGRVALWMAALFIAGFSAKLVLMHHHPVTMPFWDQWIAEAGLLYIPFNEGCLPWSTMVELHNEHRILFSRLLALGLLTINGEWDPRLQQVVNAGLHAFTAVLLAALFWLAAQRRRLDLFVIVSGLAVALPFGWENTIFGFQSAFYILLLFSVLALGLTAQSDAGSVRWFLGWTFALGAIFTTASGPFVSVAIGGIALARLVSTPRQWRDPALNLIAAGLVLGVGLAVASPPLPQHAHLQPATFGAYTAALSRNLSWPWVEDPQFVVVMWAPFVGMLIGFAFRRATATPLERMALGLGLWVLLQAGAIAYARGAQGQTPASRYMDFFSLSLVVNAGALVAMHYRAQPKVVVRRLAMAALGSWLLFAAIGLDELTRGRLSELNRWQPYWTAHEANVRRFILDDDLKTFGSKQPPSEIPYVDPGTLANAWLRHPYIRSILPARARQPVRVEPADITTNGFVRGGVYWRVSYDPQRPAWGSFTDLGHAAVGRFESEPIVGCGRFGRLRFDVAGYLGGPGHYLAVRELGSGRESVIRPPRMPQVGWAEATVACPSSSFVVVAVDQNTDSWFAFRAPVEIGWASELAEGLIRQSHKLLILGLGLSILALRWA